MEIVIIAAMAANRVIGRHNRIPWHLPSDLQQFKDTTMGYPLLMGRKTYESIGRPLPGRKTIIISRNEDYPDRNVTVAGSLREALAICHDSDKIFIAGGGEIFRQALPLADTIILSVLHRDVEGDVFFPEIPSDQFIQTEKRYINNTEDHETYSIVMYKRKTNGTQT